MQLNRSKFTSELQLIINNWRIILDGQANIIVLTVLHISICNPWFSIWARFSICISENLLNVKASSSKVRNSTPKGIRWIQQFDIADNLKNIFTATNFSIFDLVAPSEARPIQKSKTKTSKFGDQMNLTFLCYYFFIMNFYRG